MKAANSDQILEFPVETPLTDIFLRCYGHQNCAAYYNGKIVVSIDGIDSTQLNPVIIEEYKVWIKLDEYTPSGKLSQPFQTIKDLFKQEFEEWDINDYVVKQNDEMIGNTHLSVLSSIEDNPICFIPYKIWVKFEDQPPCLMDVKRIESIEECRKRHKLIRFAAKQNDVTLKGDHTLNYQLATPDNPIQFTPLDIWMKVNDSEPIKLDSKRNESIEEFMIRHKIPSSGTKTTVELICPSLFSCKN